jgi:hypothetical protein
MTNTTTIVHDTFGEVPAVWWEAPTADTVGYWYRRDEGVLHCYYPAVGWKELVPADDDKQWVEEFETQWTPERLEALRLSQDFPALVAKRKKFMSPMPMTHDFFKRLDQ